MRNLIRDLIRCGSIKGIVCFYYILCALKPILSFDLATIIMSLNDAASDNPFVVLKENPFMRRVPALARVKDMFEQIKSKLPRAPRFLLCLLSMRKKFNIRGLFLLCFFSH